MPTTQKEFKFEIASSSCELECMQLISKMMDAYAFSLSPSQRKSIVKWFEEIYYHEYAKGEIKAEVKGNILDKDIPY